METMAKKLHKGANTEIANKIVGDMNTDEIVMRLGDLNALSTTLRTQLLLKFPKTESHIDVTLLDADQRTILLCNRPTKTATKAYDVNADDMKVRQYRYVLNFRNRDLVKYMYDNITDEKLALLGINEWEDLIGYYPHAAARFNLKTIRNQSFLRNLILNKPHILRYATI